MKTDTLLMKIFPASVRVEDGQGNIITVVRRKLWSKKAMVEAVFEIANILEADDVLDKSKRINLYLLQDKRGLKRESRYPAYVWGLLLLEVLPRLLRIERYNSKIIYVRSTQKMLRKGLPLDNDIYEAI